jgi:Holliday junction resolvasome RuvABC endonuclease subunit
MADLTSTLKDAAYVTIGFGVLAFQRAQVQRQELTKQLNELSTNVEDRVRLVEERLAGLSDQVAPMAEQVEKFLDQVQTQVDVVLDDIEERLPEQARDAFGTARTAAKEASAQLRSLVLVNGGKAA